LEIRNITPGPSRGDGPITILVVVSEFNALVTERLLSGCTEALESAGAYVGRTDIVRIPGALEIPETLALLLPDSGYSAAVALGCVIRGETGHYDAVVQGVTYGVVRQSQLHGIPVVFGVLTVDTLKQALDRVGGSAGHKGREAGETALRMAALFRGRSKWSPE
jgi:6,7-dimethyl-8-ribityllumazine synthase